MEVKWDDRVGSHSLFISGKFRGVLGAHRPEYWWYNTPHKPTTFPAGTLEEAKQIALSIWAIQESVGVK